MSLSARLSSVGTLTIPTSPSSIAWRVLCMRMSIWRRREARASVGPAMRPILSRQLCLCYGLKVYPMSNTEPSDVMSFYRSGVGRGLVCAIHIGLVRASVPRGRTPMAKLRNRRVRHYPLVSQTALHNHDSGCERRERASLTILYHLVGSEPVNAPKCLLAGTLLTALEEEGEGLSA